MIYFMTKLKKPNVFLTDDIVMKDWEHDNIERYQYSYNEEGFIEFLKEKEVIGDVNKLSFENLKEVYSKEWEDWQNQARHEEVYNIPMMNALRYFPDFCEFELQQASKLCSGPTTLIYDNDLDSYAVAMTRGGMDLSPHLLDTFVNLGSGVPSELVGSISLNWNAYVDKKKHEQNCKLLAQAYREEARRYYSRAKELTTK